MTVPNQVICDADGNQIQIQEYPNAVNSNRNRGSASGHRDGFCKATCPYPGVTINIVVNNPCVERQTASNRGRHCGHYCCR
jgi:hypothetical protein